MASHGSAAGLAGITVAVGLLVAAPAMAMERVSVSSQGRQGDAPSGSRVNPSGSPAVSADGRFVAFASDASNLVRGDTNRVGDVFVRDRVGGRTTRVSTGARGGQRGSRSSSPGISANGRFVVFVSSRWVFLHDRRSGRTIRVSGRRRDDRGSRVHSVEPAISGNGRFVAFTSYAVVGHGELRDTYPLGLFVYDRRAGRTIRVGPRRDDLSNPSLSSDGDRVAFYSHGDVGATGRRGGLPEGVLVRDLSAGRTYRVEGTRAYLPHPAIAADGRYVAFTSQRRQAGGKQGIYVRDLRTGTLRRVATGLPTGNPITLAISRHGGRVAYQRPRSDGIIGSSGFPYGDVYLRDVRSGRRKLVSATRAGGRSGESGFPGLSTDGHVVAFTSRSPDLVGGDTNGATDVFARRYGARRRPRPPRFTG